MAPPPRHRYHHGALPAALLAEAVAQVREHGAEQVSLRGLAHRVGVSPSAVYQHFPDKAALLDAVCEWGFEQLTARMRAAMDAVELDGDAGAVARFLAIGRSYVEFAAAEPHLFRRMFAAPPGARDARSPRTTGGHEWDPGPGTDAHTLLLAAIDGLAQRGLLRAGVGVPQGLDLVAWSTVHGFAALAVEQLLPLDAGQLVITLFGRLVLSDEVVAQWPAEPPAGSSPGPSDRSAPSPGPESPIG